MENSLRKDNTLPATERSSTSTESISGYIDPVKLTQDVLRKTYRQK
jgi:hypothetical protein